jgi:hypothetical protein
VYNRLRRPKIRIFASDADWALGFLAGRQHALEASHTAAARDTGVADVVKQRTGWRISDMLARFLEFAVGVALVGFLGPRAQKVAPPACRLSSSAT